MMGGSAVWRDLLLEAGAGVLGLALITLTHALLALSVSSPNEDDTGHI